MRVVLDNDYTNIVHIRMIDKEHDVSWHTLIDERNISSITSSLRSMYL